MTVSEERTLQTVHAYSRPNSSLKCSILIFRRVLIARGWGEGNVGESNSKAHRAENGSLQSLLPTWRPQAYSPAKERAKFTRTLPNCKKNISHLTAKCYNFFGSASPNFAHCSYKHCASAEHRMGSVDSCWQTQVGCRESTALMSACPLISLVLLTGGRSPLIQTTIFPVFFTFLFCGRTKYFNFKIFFIFFFHFLTETHLIWARSHVRGQIVTDYSYYSS